MGMKTYAATGTYGSSSLGGVPKTRAGAKIAGYASGGTSSFPITGFPATAYLGNNRLVSGGKQGQQPNTVSALGNISQLDSRHVILFVAIVVVVGYTLWHLDYRRG